MPHWDKPYPQTPKPNVVPVPTNQPSNPRVHLQFDSQIEVRRYPSLDDPKTYDVGQYTIGAVMSDSDGILVLALQRQAEDGRTEVLQIRFDLFRMRGT
jgi:hypothetical protein